MTKERMAELLRTHARRLRSDDAIVDEYIFSPDMPFAESLALMVEVATACERHADAIIAQPTT